ncbi:MULTISPECIES: aspartate aminotransferase family protein [Pseudonocardia]|uniref:Glutamate-1-semialdehyde 2,1-aminomutase 2 n=2 Tax=Pseudonocardia TaxID=1847 RepID=A0A1Y2N839_PSEAH|nr:MULTISPECIES: aminotransferase class III-fold pyridoxal phosphate-dependent enzyme [Pseudonocardia]OSY43632.1 Glutamate-1-semialdehyde 2,1-aminomutase 2 [Pseudonocardia autotrophica]BBG04116.1 aspartate aminotransferase family protein [Pseudonocardia autotrophica]GEC25447.1 aspartate aminotransferase family protein [Pseudonocardia saturnea]
MAYPPYPFYASHGEGARLTDLDGNVYLDLINNYTSLIHGHGHARTAEAARAGLIAGQALGTPTVEEAELARELRRRLPALETVRFTSTGSEALQYAIRVARAATGRKRVLKFEGAYHGSEVSLVQDIWPRTALPPGTARPALPSSAGLDDTSTLTAVYNDAAAVASAFGQWGDEIAVVVVEPFLGNNALITATPDFLDAVFEQARAHGALVLFDEIQGLRAAYGGTQSVFGVTPDLVTVGKILSGGFALAGFGGRSDVMAHLADTGDPMPQSGTFTASPIALRAGLAALSDFGEEDYSRLRTLRDGFAARSVEEFARAGMTVHINGMGSMFHININEEPVGSVAQHLRSDHALWIAVRLGLLNRGINMMLRGTGCLSTPMKESDIDIYGDALRDVLSGI